MNIQIKFAQTVAELQGIFTTRHIVFVEQEGYMEATPTRQLFDVYDAYPTTVNIVALADGQVIGGLRFMCATDAGMSTDEFLDYSEYVPFENARVGCVSLLCVRQEYRGTKISDYLFAMGHYWVYLRNLSHIIGAANPKTMNLLMRQGYRPVGQENYCPAKGLNFIPIVLCRESLERKWGDFIKRQKGDEYWLAMPDSKPMLSLH